VVVITSRQLRATYVPSLDILNNKQLTETALVDLTNFSVHLSSIAHKLLSTVVISVHNNPNLDAQFT